MAELEDDSRENVIRYNIQDFLPYICDCVKATDLLPHLHFYTSEQKKDIFRLCGQNNVKGMQKAMQILLHEVDDMGRFTAFRKAIEDSDYPKIVKMLDGETVAYDENCRKLIDLFAKEIIGRLNPEDLLPSLVSEGVLTGNDTDEVRAEEKNHGKGRACWMLLFHLPNRVENWFRIFMNVLVDSNYTDIAEILEPDLYQKILLQREETIKASANLKQADDSRKSLLTGLKRKDFSDEPVNQKLVKMQEIVTFDKNAEAREIVFEKTRELVQALGNWMKETEPLNTLDASDFAGGQAASKLEGGMTQCAQKDVLEYFKDGRHKIIVESSVAREGLDITEYKVVIQCKHVTDDVGRLRSGGRTRMQDSRYYVMTEEGSWIDSNEVKNAMPKDVRNNKVQELQADIDYPNLQGTELQDLQEADCKGFEEFRCLNCCQFICFLLNIRKIQGAHHVVVDEHVGKSFIAERKQPSFIDDGLEFGGAIFCGNEDCQSELGGMCVYKHAIFPLLRIKNFIVVDKNNKRNTFRQWKKANFEVEPFTLDDLRRVAERRSGIIYSRCSS